MRRRDFLSASAGAALLALGRGASAAASDAPKRLFVVLLRGAADGLNIVVPYGDDAYYAARPTIAIAKPGAEEGALALDEHFGLHPALSALIPLWQEKQLAFAHAAGSPDPTRSHFAAQLFIENGTPGTNTTPDGWLNRLLAAVPGVSRGPTDAVAVGPTLPHILKGRVPVANLPLGPAAATPLAIDKPEIASAFDRLYARKDALGQAYRHGRVARAELIAGLPAPPEPADNGAPGANGFPAVATRLAGLLAHDRKIRLAVVSLGGWDTHVRQGNHAGQLAERLRPLGDGLAAFAKGLGPDWRDTVIVVLSEFGRTVRENGDGGTDHGHGNVIWVLGGSVRGGQVCGDWPGLASAALYEGRDLPVTSDFRGVLTAVAARHLRVPDRTLGAIFPSFAAPPSAMDRIIA